MAIFETTRRVQFRDTDAAGIVHFSVFFTYMEEAEHEFWRSLGESVITEIDEVIYSWPRVSAKCDYQSPLRFEEHVDIQVSIKRIGSKSVTFDFDFIRGEAKIANGSITAVCVKLKNKTIDGSVVVPQKLRDLLAKYVSQPDKV